MPVLVEANNWMRNVMKTALIFMALILTSMSAQAEIIGKTIDYSDGETSMKGYIALQLHNGDQLHIRFKDIFIRAATEK